MCADAQTDDMLKERFPFLHTENNEVIQEQAMRPFFLKLDSLKSGQIRQVKVLHIGDSHLQADIFTAELRRLMQQEFGNAGRGFVFPYKVARTNGPEDYKSGGYGVWSPDRMVMPHSSHPIGLSGITLSSNDSDALVYINLKDESAKDYAFDRVTVYRQTGPAYFDLGLGTELPDMKNTEMEFDTHKKHTVKSGESLGVIARKHHTTISQIKKWNNLRSNNIRAGQVLIVGASYRPKPAEENSQYQDVFCIPSTTGAAAVSCQLPQLSTSLYLRNMVSSPQQTSTVLYGLTLENSKKSGVLYHTIGVNGAQYVHYNRAEYFAEQAQLLNPDLVIISLGTNEAFARDLTEDQLYTAIDSLVSRLSTLLPDACFLLCTQPDTYLKSKNKNPRNIMISQTITNYAQTRFTGIWDMNAVGGGYGSMNHWFTNGLAAKDRVHFSYPGYRLQGQLLFNALLKSYEHHRSAGY